MAPRRTSSFNLEDRNQLREINKTVKSLRNELRNMKSELTAVRAKNNQLKQALNLTNYRLNSLEQYGIRENLRIHNVPESLTNGDGGEAEAIKIANAINISLNKDDVIKLQITITV